MFKLIKRLFTGLIHMQFVSILSLLSLFAAIGLGAAAMLVKDYNTSGLLATFSTIMVFSTFIFGFLSGRTAAY